MIVRILGSTRTKGNVRSKTARDSSTTNGLIGSWCGRLDLNPLTRAESSNSNHISGPHDPVYVGELGQSD